MKIKMFYVAAMLIIAVLITGCVGNTNQRAEEGIKEYRVLNIFRGTSWPDQEYYLVDYQSGVTRKTVRIYGDERIFPSIADESTLQIHTYSGGNQYALFISNKTQIKTLN